MKMSALSQESQSIVNTEINDFVANDVTTVNSDTAVGGCIAAETNVEDESSLHNRQVRTVYLITYSQADLTRVAKREDFASLVVEAFTGTCEVDNIVNQWACSMEPHQNAGYHYHMAVKLKQARRWLSVRRWLQNRHGIQVNFSNVHTNYYSAWKYTTKQDKSYVQSHGHPDLSTTRASSSTRATSRTKKGKKKQRLSVYDVSQLVVKKGIRTRLGLLALANEQKKAGKDDLAQFIANRSPKVVAEAISVGWEMEQAQEKLDRQKLTRIQMLEKALESECTEGCGGEWLSMAESVLANNGITCASFARAVHELLEKGRGKYRNVMITGPANCGKTFLLNPLNKIYSTFTNPASSTFAWVGAESCEVIFLNDFRWSPQVLAWNDMLLLLEGQTVHFPAPKCHFTQDITFDADTPIFCTGKQEIFLVKGGSIDERESEMMRVRWMVFRFNFQIAEKDQRVVPPCSKCFAELILRPCLL